MPDLPPRNAQQSDAKQSDAQSLGARVRELEELLMHLQRQVQDLDAVLLDQSRRIDRQQRQIDRTASELRTVEAATEASRDLSDEKPPHY